MEKTYRIKANVGIDQTINLQVQNNVDAYEILSLSLRQSDLYRLQKSGYGVIVGRILANNAFGVPNAKVSVFIPLSSEDINRTSLKAIYPFNTVTDTLSNGIRYNILPGKSSDDGVQVVGTFPTKRMILDNDAMLEVYEKYYKYTTTTNQSGDYMIFGVPTGQQELHVDVDLSDIGLLSQRPSDFISKGYNANQFESASAFKKSESLESLPQIFTQNETVDVNPFWGSEDLSEISITRKDINLQYEFETTCVFIGSIMTDSIQNVVTHDCKINEFVGDASQITTCKGNIEMIRKTIYGTIEEKKIDDNQLIDENGVWCYKIPMNLDFIATDEYGNIVPSNDPSKGIATRASVRFRVSIEEPDDDTMTKHKARYLIPCNPDLYERTTQPFIPISSTTSGDCITPEDYYEFGTNTPDNCFRDLFWNKVYSVKGFIPRIQRNNFTVKTHDYIGIKNVNKNEAQGINPIPYNKLRTPASIYSAFFIQNVSGFKNWIRRNSDVSNNVEDSTEGLSGATPSTDEIYGKMAQDTNRVGLCFYNDWLNGCLYFPTWYWKVREKKKYKSGQVVYSSEFCNCKSTKGKKVYLMNGGSYKYSDDDFTLPNSGDSSVKDFARIQPDSTNGLILNGGIIYQKTNSDDTNVYYYAFGDNNKIGDGTITPYDNVNDSVKVISENENDGQTVYYGRYRRLFSTDLILLGSLVDNDINGIPKMKGIPSTTCNIPPMTSIRDEEEDEETSGTSVSAITTNGMNWGINGGTRGRDYVGYYYDTGLFFGLTENIGVKTLQKSCINAERICELGVAGDSNIVYNSGSSEADINIDADGFITETDVDDDDLRSLFATLNNNKLVATVRDENTGYMFYNLTGTYPVGFDGRLDKSISGLVKNTPAIRAEDVQSLDYVFFRTGGFDNGKLNANVDFDNYNKSYIKHFRRGSLKGIKNNEKDAYYEKFAKRRHFYCTNGSYSFPLYENSFYFYFGVKNGGTAIDKYNEIVG